MTFLTFLTFFAFSAARRLSELLVLFAYVGLQFIYKSHQILITQQSSISANKGQVIKRVVMRMRMVQRCGDTIVPTRTRLPLLVWNCRSCRHLGLLSSSSRSLGDAGVNKKSIDKRRYACWYARVDTLWLGVVIVRESWGRSGMATVVVVVVTRRLGVGNTMLGLRVVAAAGGSPSDHIREKKQGYIKGVLASVSRP